MPIPLTCSCGAKLVIDDKFAGQTIACPDCNKPLVAEPPAPQPTRTSGLAVLSLLLALVGAFTIVGTLAAIACGAVAYRQLSRIRGPAGGIRIAQAGMILGAVLTVVAVAAYATSGLLGLDSLARQYVWAGKLKYPLGSLTVNKKARNDDGYSIERPSPLWGVLDSQTSQQEGDHLLLVNLRDDAHIFWLSDRVLLDDDAASMRNRARDYFLGSSLLKFVGRVPENASASYKERDVNEHDFLLDISIGGISRTFFFYLRPQGQQYVNVLVFGTRAHRFEKLKPIIQPTIENFKQEK